MPFVKGQSGNPAGRKKGAKTKATIEREIRAVHGVTAAVQEGALPLDIILRVMRGDTEITKLQFDAAIAAAPYVHARLSSATVTHRDPLDSLTDDELRAFIAHAASRTDAGDGESSEAQTGEAHPGEPYH